ncbi:MFS-type transporter SLC18B1-like isoform X7 [Patiria miniata]|uniref:Major facilitator superfamily (MFS) profile domain-containing protein n=1 Tax=Patiria miniata TaxID=46514 RepID=A0A914ADU3_PATMI|nr:MFS-type transporter SLC18B1-like isoform X7 [Patiria miniata]
MELQTHENGNMEGSQKDANSQVPSPMETPPRGLATPEEAVNADGDQQPAKSRFTSHQIATIVGTFFAALTNMMAYSVITVFYPIEAKKRGISQTVIGMVFSVFSLSYSIGSPLIGKMIPIVGARFAFLAGSFITGGCNILFGFIIDMPTNATFTGFSFAIRILEGLGSAAALTSSSAIVASVCPDDVGKAVSLVETTVGFSFAIGPAVGGLLYHVAGFRIPFFVLGGLVLSTVVVNYFLMPNQGNEAEESSSVRRVLSIPAVWVALFANFVGFAATASLEPTLAIFLDELNFSVMAISLLFVSLGLGYGLFAVIWGAIADAKDWGTSRRYHTHRSRNVFHVGYSNVCRHVTFCRLIGGPVARGRHHRVLRVRLFDYDHRLYLFRCFDHHVSFWHLGVSMRKREAGTTRGFFFGGQLE